MTNACNRIHQKVYGVRLTWPQNINCLLGFGYCRNWIIELFHMELLCLQRSTYCFYHKEILLTTGEENTKVHVGAKECVQRLATSMWNGGMSLSTLWRLADIWISTWRLPCIYMVWLLADGEYKRVNSGRPAYNSGQSADQFVELHFGGKYSFQKGNHHFGVHMSFS